jgi:preprotein translocase subunit SecY
MLIPQEHFNWISFLGMWKESVTGTLIPISGLCFWLAQPNLSTLFSFQTLVYAGYMVVTSSLFSGLSIKLDSSDNNPQNLIEDLLGPTHLTLIKKKEIDSDEALKVEVSRLVPAAAILGGLALGTVCVISDVLGVTGGGTGLLLSMKILYQVFDAWLEESNKGLAVP